MAFSSRQRGSPDPGPVVLRGPGAAAGWSAVVSALLAGCAPVAVPEPDGSAGGDSTGDTGDTGIPTDTGAGGPCEAPRTEGGAELYVGRTLPVVNEPVSIEVTEGGSLCVRFDGASGEVATLVDGAWTPARTGKADLWGLDPDGNASEARTVWVTPTRLFFDFWIWRDDQAWITSGLSVESQSDADEISGRDLALRHKGALPLNWTWGSNYPAVMDISDYLELMGLGYPDNGYPGIVVDEVFGTGEADERYGEALVQARETWPEMYIAIYTVSGVSSGNPSLLAGLDAADLVIAETYTTDFRSYDAAFDRYESLVRAGLRDHAIGAICVACATTVQEIRQQLSYARTRFPEMPGVAWFSAPASNSVAESLDSLIEEAFLGPVVIVQTDGAVARVRSIGATDVGLVLVHFLDASGSTVETVEIPSLPSGTEALVEASTAFSSVQLELPEGGADLTWVDPASLPAPSSAESEAAAAWREGFAAGTALAVDDHLELTSIVDGVDVTGAEVLLDGMSEGSAFAVSATVRLDYAWSYGQVGIGLSDGTQSLMATLYHGDDDGDVPGDVPRVTASLAVDGAAGVQAVSIPGLEPGTGATAILFISYGDGAIRSQLLDLDGTLRWDSGELAVDPSFVPDRLRISTRSSPDSYVAWEDGGLRAFGTAGSVYDYVYSIDALFSDIEVYVR